MSLQLIRQKVEAGQPLARDEFDVLRRAAQAESGPRLKTVVAQALLNADAGHDALPLLENLRRDFPHDADVHLALARALMLLERFTDAEAPLLMARRLDPGGLQAPRALALLALRRGELNRARAHVDEALQLDPEDAEALLLDAELKAQVALGEPPSVAEFSRALGKALTRRSTPHLFQKQHLLLRVGKGEVARVDLASLHQDTLAAGQSVGEAVELIARELTERTLGLTKGARPLLEQVLPVVRDSAFLERGIGAAKREGPAGLWIFYAVEDPELVRYVPEGALAASSVALEQLDASAWANLERRPTEVRALALDQGALRLSATPTGLWGLAHGDGHDAARLLTRAHQQAIRERVGEGPYRVYLGLRELVLLAVEGDVGPVKLLEGLDPARDGIGGRFRLTGQKLEAV